MALAVAATLGLWLAAWLWPDWERDLADRAALLGLALLGPAISLAAGVAFIARHRFFTPAAIDGADPADDRVLRRAHAYLANTTEQALLAALAYPSIAFGVSAAWLPVLVLLPIAFFVGRIGFARGVGLAAERRAFGFALTFYPTMTALLAGAAGSIARLSG